MEFQTKAKFDENPGGEKRHGKFRQDWPLGLTGLISLQTKGLSRVFSSNTIGKHQFFEVQPSFFF